MTVMERRQAKEREGMEEEDGEEEEEEEESDDFTHKLSAQHAMDTRNDYMFRMKICRKVKWIVFGTKIMSRKF